MIGVCIGVGEYLPLARQAAATMSEHTGLQCVVLSNEHYQAAGFTDQPPHLLKPSRSVRRSVSPRRTSRVSERLAYAGVAKVPSAARLKLRVWDFVDDQDVLLFDADTVCLRDWNPAELAGTGRLHAVRDWTWRDGVQREAAATGVPAAEYFLSSLLLLNRPQHEQMLRLAEKLYPTIPTNVYEQNALNAARRQLNLPVTFLDRRYCWSRFGAGGLHEQAGVIVGHYNDDEFRARWQFYGSNTSVGAVDADAFSSMGNKYYRYSRIGYDERPLFLRDDGTIGDGGGAAERFWFVTANVDGPGTGSFFAQETIPSPHRATTEKCACPRASPKLIIGGEDDVTCELTRHGDGIWRGAWTAYERMPIEFMLHRGQVIVDLLGRRRRSGAGSFFGSEWPPSESSVGRKMCLTPSLSRPLVGAELGVFEGQTSRLLLQALPNLTLWMVDPWIKPQPGERYYADPYMRLVSPEQMEEALRRARARTDFARDRRIIVMADQVTAARCVDDTSLDFVFIDSDHSREGTLEAIETWWSKLRPGGFMIGHDLDYPGFPGVREAVEQAAAAMGVTWHRADDYVWWFEFCQEADESIVKQLEYSSLPRPCDGESRQTP